MKKYFKYSIKIRRDRKHKNEWMVYLKRYGHTVFIAHSKSLFWCLDRTVIRFMERLRHS